MKTQEHVSIMMRLNESEMQSINFNKTTERPELERVVFVESSKIESEETDVFFCV